jgi:hypothetical protein
MCAKIVSAECNFPGLKRANHSRRDLCTQLLLSLRKTKINISTPRTPRRGADQHAHTHALRRI